MKHIIDISLLPLVFLSGLILKAYRRIGSQRLCNCSKVLKKLGVFPIRDHYYEPLFNYDILQNPLNQKRFLPGIDFREEQQIEFLQKLNFQKDFEDFLHHQDDKEKDLAFKFNNGSFESGDAEFLFNFVRRVKPNNVIEIGCGTSTKLISHALMLNKIENQSDYKHICIDPYEQPWLEKMEDVEVLRQKLEDIDISLFNSLSQNDFLFIDSSHIIRPQGDVLREYLEIIPSLSSGVYVHVHDIFSPHDYLETWIKDNVRFWNEQYILESSLSNNSSYQIVAALNFLKNYHYDSIKAVCPFLTPDREPGSFYFKTV